VKDSAQPFPKSFFLQPTVEVARGLLGALLVRLLPQGRLAGRIVEVEAYCQGDGACHAVRRLKDGTCVPRRSTRNATLFGPPGHAYVYFTYGAHHALNVAAQAAGIGEGVLIRALEPLEGLEIMTDLRGTPIDPQGRWTRALASGPGKLTQALAIDRRLDGHDLSQPPLMLLRGRRVHAADIGVSCRIGLTHATDTPWRFFVKDSPFVSRRSPSTRP